jgi:hypothetical protein
MSVHVPGTWWAIERFDTERREWVLQWNPAAPCWPRLFRTRAEVRAYLRAEHEETMRVHREQYPVDLGFLRTHWRQRPVKVRVVPA